MRFERGGSYIDGPHRGKKLKTWQEFGKAQDFTRRCLGLARGDRHRIQASEVFLTEDAALDRKVY
jgi:hypothetical protein